MFKQTMHIAIHTYIKFAHTDGGPRSCVLHGRWAEFFWHMRLQSASKVIHQQDRRLTLKISLRHLLLRRYGLRRAHLQQRHLQAHEADEQPLRHQEPLQQPNLQAREAEQIHTIGTDQDEPPYP